MRERVLLDSLAQAVPGFRTYLDALDHRRHDVSAALAQVLALEHDGIRARITNLGKARVGARPTHEHEAGRIAIAHPDCPLDRDAAVAFAERVLHNTPAAFVDGSQVPVDNDLSVPFGMALIHGSHARPGQPLAKHDAATALSPADIETWRGHGVWSADQVVNFGRWSMELQYLIDCMERHPGTVAMFDGSLIHSFTTGLPPALRAAYDALRNEALAVSERTRSPLVGYIDNSRARDLVALVGALGAIATDGVTDSALLAPHLADLGARTSAWITDRDDGSIDGQSAPIAFHYALLGPGGPCRIEYPAWVLESGQHTLVHDQLLAQCLAYGGYPRSIDECHIQCSIGPGEAAAVQAAFLRLSEEHGLPVQASWKARSKRRGARL